jgi:hypothetical protein
MVVAESTVNPVFINSPNCSTGIRTELIVNGVDTNRCGGSQSEFHHAENECIDPVCKIYDLTGFRRLLRGVSPGDLS